MATIAEWARCPPPLLPVLVFHCSHAIVVVLETTMATQAINQLALNSYSGARRVSMPGLVRLQDTAH